MCGTWIQSPLQEQTKDRRDLENTKKVGLEALMREKTALTRDLTYPVCYTDISSFTATNKSVPCKYQHNVQIEKELQRWLIE